MSFFFCLLQIFNRLHRKEAISNATDRQEIVKISLKISGTSWCHSGEVWRCSTRISPVKSLCSAFYSTRSASGSAACGEALLTPSCFGPETVCSFSLAGVSKSYFHTFNGVYFILLLSRDVEVVDIPVPGVLPLASTAERSQT